MSPVLIVSSRGDWSAEQVAQQLDARGASFSWLAPSDFPQRVRVTAELDNRWSGEVETPAGIFSWEDVSAVFYRRPRDFDMPAGMSDPERRFARAQARAGLGGVLSSLPATWINHPSALADAEYKPWQLVTARSVGLQVPATLVTNDHNAVRQFAEAAGDLVVKSLAEPIIAEAGTQHVVWTRKTGHAELTDLAGLELTTHLFQEWVPKAYEVRLIMVGEKSFAVAIHAHSPSTRVDWRTDYAALTYEVVDCPTDITDRAHTFLAAAGLYYGAFDFIVSADRGEYVFWNATRRGNGVGSPRNAGFRSPRPSRTN